MKELFAKKQEEYLHLVKHFLEKKAVVPLTDYWMTLNLMTTEQLIERDWEDQVPNKEIRYFIGENIDELAGFFILNFESFEKKISWNGPFVYEEVIQLFGIRSELENVWLVFNKENKEALKKEYSCDLERLDREFKELIERNKKEFKSVIASVHTEPLKYVPLHWWWQI